MENLKKIVKELRESPQTAFPRFAEELKIISTAAGLQGAYNRLLQAEVMLNLRKPKLAIYDHAFHFIGGAQKYGLTLIHALQNRFDIQIIANKEVNHRDFLDWYKLDLSNCKIKIIKLPFFEEKNVIHLDPACVTKKDANPFHSISRESGNHDIFINNSMNEMVYPLSNISVLICHFPERRPKTYFYADQYTHIVYNSRYTARWIAKKWDITPNEHIYPPVDMEPSQPIKPKKKTILSVARFEPEGTKRQKEMIEAFSALLRGYPRALEGWKFMLIGGTPSKNPYLEKLENMIDENLSANIQLKSNIPIEQLRSCYQESTLFWHLCGLTHRDPSEIEHFGMTAVEAMQNRAVPIVYDGGGLAEIVDHGVNGFRVKSKTELMDYTLKLIHDEKLLQNFAENAQKKSRQFTRIKFEERIQTFFDKLLRSYESPGVVDRVSC